MTADRNRHCHCRAGDGLFFVRAGRVSAAAFGNSGSLAILAAIRRVSHVMHKWVASNAREHDGILDNVIHNLLRVDDKACFVY
jgi:hypothetical protein